MNAAFGPLVRQAAIEGAIAFAMRRNHRSDLAGAGIMAMAGVVALFGFVFLATGLFFWLEPLYGQAVAAWIAGFGLLAVTLLLVWLGYRAAFKKKAASEKQVRSQVEQVYDLLAEEVAGEIGEPVRENPKTSLAAAAVAGFVAGEKM